MTVWVLKSIGVNCLKIHDFQLRWDFFFFWKIFFPRVILRRDGWAVLWGKIMLTLLIYKQNLCSIISFYRNISKVWELIYCFSLSLGRFIHFSHIWPSLSFAFVVANLILNYQRKWIMNWFVQVCTKKNNNNTQF